MSATPVKDPAKRVWTVPNVLSMLRLAMVPLYAWLYFSGYLYGAVAVLFLSCVTDLADGRIARRFNQITDLGKALDPVADKCSQGVVMICLAFTFPRLIWLIAVLAGKELINALTGLARIRVAHEVPYAKLHGKLATTALDVTAGLYLLWAILWPPDSAVLNVITLVLVHVCLALMLVSVVLYTRENLTAVKRAREKEKEAAQADA